MKNIKQYENNRIYINCKADNVKKAALQMPLNGGVPNKNVIIKIIEK
jgi:hypothetical protein